MKEGERRAEASTQSFTRRNFIRNALPIMAGVASGVIAEQVTPDSQIDTLTTQVGGMSERLDTHERVLRNHGIVLLVHDKKINGR